MSLTEIQQRLLPLGIGGTVPEFWKTKSTSGNKPKSSGCPGNPPACPGVLSSTYLASDQWSSGQCQAAPIVPTGRALKCPQPMMDAALPDQPCLEEAHSSTSGLGGEPILTGTARRLASTGMGHIPRPPKMQHMQLCMELCRQVEEW